MPPAARVGDQHACPKHTGGSVTDGSPTVNIGGAPAARVGDRMSCRGPADTIVQGSPTVFIESRPAARAGDRCAHSGVILTGLQSVVIGNEGSAAGSPAGGGGSSPDRAGDAGGTAPHVSGTPVSTPVLNSIVSLARQLASGQGVAPATQAAIESTATELEVSLARNDLGAVQNAVGTLQQVLPQAGVRVPGVPGAGGGEPRNKDQEDHAAPVPAPVLGWQAPGAIPADPPRAVTVSDGRIAINGRFVGIHAISEHDLIELQAAGRIEQVVQRLVSASAAGRNAVRIFCMYRNRRSSLSPWSTPGYWTAVDAIVRRLTAYGLVGEFVLLADCDRRPDGTGGVMPSWDDRRAFVREAGQFLKGRPVIACGMNEPFRNGAAAADDPRLVEITRVFREASGGTVPFSIGDPRDVTDEDALLVPTAQRTLAANGASILVVHSRRRQPDDRRYRWWVDRLSDFGALRNASLAGNPYLYHNEPMGFGSRREEGQRENDPEAAVAAACVCAIGQMGFCYHRIAAEDPATPGLELTRVATLIPQSPDFSPCDVGAPTAPIQSFDKEDFRGGAIHVCSNGREAWAVGYGKHAAKNPRVKWRDLTPEIIWRGERVILWRAQ